MEEPIHVGVGKVGKVFGLALINLIIIDLVVFPELLDTLLDFQQSVSSCKRLLCFIDLH